MCCSRKNNPEYKLAVLLVEHFKAKWPFVTLKFLPSEEIADRARNELYYAIDELLKEFSKSIEPLASLKLRPIHKKNKLEDDKDVDIIQEIWDSHGI